MCIHCMTHTRPAIRGLSYGHIDHIVVLLVPVTIALYVLLDLPGYRIALNLTEHNFHGFRRFDSNHKIYAHKILPHTLFREESNP